MAAESEPLAGPEHLNNSGCVIKLSPGKGRGVYGQYLDTFTLRVRWKLSHLQLPVLYPGTRS